MTEKITETIVPETSATEIQAAPESEKNAVGGFFEKLIDKVHEKADKWLDSQEDPAKAARTLENACAGAQKSMRIYNVIAPIAVARQTENPGMVAGIVATGTVLESGAWIAKNFFRVKAEAYERKAKLNNNQIDYEI